METPEIRIEMEQFKHRNTVNKERNGTVWTPEHLKQGEKWNSLRSGTSKIRR